MRSVRRSSGKKGSSRASEVGKVSFRDLGGVEKLLQQVRELIEYGAASGDDLGRVLSEAEQRRKRAKVKATMKLESEIVELLVHAKRDKRLLFQAVHAGDGAIVSDATPSTVTLVRLVVPALAVISASSVPLKTACAMTASRLVKGSSPLAAVALSMVECVSRMASV